MRYEDVDWGEAACHATDTDSFYPVNGIPLKTVARICESCPILSDCAAYAIENEHYGYWGGMSEHARLLMRRRMARRRAS